MKTEQYKKVVGGGGIMKASTPRALLSNSAAHSSAKIRVTIENEICIGKQDVPEEMMVALRKRLTWDNPRYLKNLRFGRKEAGIPPKLSCLQEDEENLLIARGFASELIKILHQFRVRFEIYITAVENPRVAFRFKGTLQEQQKTAFDEIFKRRYGVLSGPDHSGKMVLALYLICERQLPAVVVVKKKDRLYEWRDTICRFLGCNHADVGLIGDGHKELGQNITVAIDRSLYRHIAELKQRTGFLIVDRCDTANLKIFFKAVAPFTPRYTLGLARSGRRADGLTDLMHAYLGPMLFSFSPQESIGDSGMAGRIFHIRQTASHFDYQENYSEMISALCADGPRNEMIIADVLYEASKGNSRILVISERIEHLQHLKELLSAAYFAKSDIISGTTRPKKREGVAALISQGKIRVLMTTLKSVETITCKKFNVLIIACPVKASDLLTQAIGSLLPGTENQPSVIYDYQDGPNILKASLRRRIKAYRSLGFSFGGKESTNVVH